MKLSVRTRYAVRLLLDLAAHEGNAPRSASQMSASTDVPEHYIAQVLTPLRAAGIVRSVRGASGGHTLLKDAADITLGDIYRATEGDVTLTECCADPSRCPRAAECPTRGVWLRVSRTLEKTLDSYTLQDLL